MSRINLDNPNPTRYQRLQVSTYGHVYIGKFMKPGWKSKGDFYLFLCKKHGYVTNLAQGHRKRLECPLCLKEKTK